MFYAPNERTTLIETRNCPLSNERIRWQSFGDFQKELYFRLFKAQTAIQEGYFGGF